MTNVKKIYLPINGQSALLKRPIKTNIYGAEWDGTSSPSWIRTDDSAYFPDPSPALNNGTGYSPFDSIYPWAGIRRVTDSTAGELVEIPKYYYKWTYSGTKMKLQISPLSFPGSKVSPAHADRGDGVGERDIVYVGRYHCANTYKSVTGYVPTVSKTRAAFRTGIHGLGSTIWQSDFAMFWTIRMLYLVEFADWNSQGKIGYGCGNGSSVENNGLTDAMQYHTGTDGETRNTSGHTQYRYIEDLWSNVLEWCDGIYFSGTSVYAIKNPASFSDTTGGTKVGTRPSQESWIKAYNHPTSSGLEYALYPSALADDGGSNKYICDKMIYSQSGETSVVLATGSWYGKSNSRGLFNMYDGRGASYGGNVSGSRLMVLP